MRASRIQLTRWYQHEQKPTSPSRYRTDPLDSDFLVNLCLSSCRQSVWRIPYRGSFTCSLSPKNFIARWNTNRSSAGHPCLLVPTLHVKFLVNFTKKKTLLFKRFLMSVRFSENVHVMKKFFLQLKGHCDHCFVNDSSFAGVSKCPQVLR